MFAATNARAQFTSTPLPTRASRGASLARGPLRVAAAAQTLEGVVVSASGAKSKVVLVSRKVPHPKYTKRMNVSKKFMFHDEDDSCKVGDRVEVRACRPMSKSKRFTLERVTYACKTDEDCPVA